MAIDTLTIARDLKAAKVPAEQAEAIASAIGRSAGDSMEHAATKADLTHLATRLESKIDTKIEQLRSQMIVWFAATNLTLGAIIIAAMKL